MRHGKILAVALAAAISLAGCSSGGSTAGEEGLKQLTVSGISSTTQYLPVYIAQQKGWFTDAGVEVEDVLFTSGPVQMESLSSDSWDLGLTGVGGVLAGAIRYDALIVSASSTDDAGQYVFVRKDSPVVAAGQGHNTLSPDIYGDAESWKGANVLSSTGTTLQYTVIKMLNGFGLTKDDVNFIAMDGPTIYSSFLAGEGDAAALGNAEGAFTVLRMDEYVAAANGRNTDTGLMTNIMVNRNSYADEEKYEAMKLFMKVYFESAQWISENPDEAAEYMLTFLEECGASADLQTCQDRLSADQYYTVEEAYTMATENEEGQDISVMEAALTDALQFFVDSGNYQESDKEIFANHVDTKLITDVYELMK